MSLNFAEKPLTFNINLIINKNRIFSNTCTIAKSNNNYVPKYFSVIRIYDMNYLGKIKYCL